MFCIISDRRTCAWIVRACRLEWHLKRNHTDGLCGFSLLAVANGRLASASGSDSAFVTHKLGYIAGREWRSTLLLYAGVVISPARDANNDVMIRCSTEIDVSKDRWLAEVDHPGTPARSIRLQRPDEGII